MSSKAETIVGAICMGLWVVVLELFAVWYITGSMPWNL